MTYDVRNVADLDGDFVIVARYVAISIDCVHGGLAVQAVVIKSEEK